MGIGRIPLSVLQSFIGGGSSGMSNPFLGLLGGQQQQSPSFPYTPLPKQPTFGLLASPQAPGGFEYSPIPQQSAQQPESPLPMPFADEPKAQEQAAAGSQGNPLLAALGMGLLARAQSRDANMVGTAMQAYPAFQKQQEKAQLGAALQKGALDDPEVAKALAQSNPELYVKLKLAERAEDKLTSTTGKALHDREMIKKIYGENSPEYQLASQAAENAAAGKQGMQFVMDPETKQITVTQGGTGTGTSGILTTGGLIKDTATGPGRGGGGATYTDPQTGAKYSTLTPQNVTEIQKQILAADNVADQLDVIIKNMPQFQSGWTQMMEKGAVQLNKWLGAGIDLPNQLALGKSAIKLAPESMLKNYGLRVTDKATQDMREALEPIEGETSDGYRRRVLGQLEAIKMRQQRGRDVLGSAISLDPVPSFINSGPGGSPQAGAQPAQGQFVEGQTYRDGSGKLAVFKNGKFYDPNTGAEV